MTKIEEIWKDIPGYDGFQASNIGRIKSLARASTRQKNGVMVTVFRKEKIREVTVNLHGYLIVNINGKTLRIARLVLMAFVGLPEEPRIYANHINGIKTDNRLCNLEWATPRENNIHYSKSRKSLPVGVRQYKNSSRFYAQKTINGELKYIGSFRTVEEAEQARNNFMPEYI